MSGLPNQPFLDVRSTDVRVAGHMAGVAVSLGRAQLFFSVLPELSVLDGRRFEGLPEIERAVRKLLPAAPATLRDRVLVFRSAAARAGSGRHAGMASARRMLRSALGKARRAGRFEPGLPTRLALPPLTGS